MESQNHWQPPSLTVVTERSVSTANKTKREVAQTKPKSSTALPKISNPVPRTWAGGCAVLIAGGPSLTDEQCQCVEEYHQQSKCYVLGVNDAYRHGFITIDALYAADTKWWKLHAAKVRESTEAPLFTQCIKAAAEYELWHIPGAKKPTRPGLCMDPAHIHFGDNSGYQAINLAYHLGVKNIVLLGYDFNSPGAHWFGEHEGGINVKSNFAAWVPKMRPLADDLDAVGVRVMNCSTNSALDCFPKMGIIEAMRWMQRPCFDTLEWPDERSC